MLHMDSDALCAAVTKSDILETMVLVFSGADVMCPTGDPVYNTPYLFSKDVWPMFLHHNRLSEMKRWWCTIENNFLKYYENETAPVADGVIDLSEVICLVVHPSDFSSNGMAAFTFEIYFLSERMFLFGAENVESCREWTRAIAKLGVVIAPYIQFVVFFPAANDSVLNSEKENILLLVENGRTFYIHGHTMLVFTVRHSAIEKAAGTDGNALQDQQLSKNNIPIIVNSCIAFVTQYGLGSKSLHLKNGNPSQVRELLEEFKKDAQSIKLKVGKHQLEDVTDGLKYFFYEIDDALLTKELYPYWISALDIQNDQEQVRKYKTVIGTLPVQSIQKCFDVNHLDTRSLAKAFSSCLFQTNGENEQEVAVLIDLIANYVNIFNISEDQVQQMETENRFITKWKRDPAELTNCALGIKNITLTKEMPWATFKCLMQHKEKVLETVLQWSSLFDPEVVYLLVKPSNTRDVMTPGMIPVAFIFSFILTEQNRSILRF
ncbi:hypothetical protein XELAEV_18005198mg [Xenopus laevis]|uniref:PH domain-containing protein n=1 Tax=Xenopus laevis TaxID=8355 RepID=A0A974DWV1_XENLA|nr:hypothetical protein XELAEV_18005198mg [Xenopus laevis]